MSAVLQGGAVEPLFADHSALAGEANLMGRAGCGTALSRDTYFLHPDSGFLNEMEFAAAIQWANTHFRSAMPWRPTLTPRA